MSGSRPETATGRGIDVVEDEVLHVRVLALEPRVAGMQDFVRPCLQQPYSAPEFTAGIKLVLLEPLIRDVLLGPELAPR